MTTFEERQERIRTKNQRAIREADAKVLLVQFGSVSRKYFANPNPIRRLDLEIIEQKFNALFA